VNSVAVVWVESYSVVIVGDSVEPVLLVETVVQISIMVTTDGVTVTTDGLTVEGHSVVTESLVCTCVPPVLCEVMEPV